MNIFDLKSIPVQTSPDCFNFKIVAMNQMKYGFLITIIGSFFSMALFAQSPIDLQGKVIDSATSEPLPGVTVSIAGSKKGVITDQRGEFNMAAVSSSGELTISMTGYTTKAVPIGGKTFLTIKLSASTASLKDVIVVGYGTQKKIENTGAIASVKSEELTQTPIANIGQGLQARVAGLQVNQNSGSPGGNVSVRLRGINSINGASEPLYIIDGIQISNGGGLNSISPLSTINPNDIASVEVLKDASASAIYGARAANGVIIITTKRGASGPTRVHYDGYAGMQKTPKKLPVLNATQFAELENEVFKNTFYPDPSSLGAGTDWQDLVFRKAPIQNHQLSIAGGNNKTRLALSFNYFDQKGILVNSGFKRYSLRINLDHEVNDWLTVGTSILGSYSISNEVPNATTAGDGGAVVNSILGAAIGAPPTLVPYREDGSIFPYGDQMDGHYREVINPMNFTAILNQYALKRTLANVYGEFRIAKGFTYRASFNTDMQSGLTDTYSPRSIVSTGDLNDESGSASKTNSNYTFLQHESILTYATKFATDHSLKVTGVFATQAELSNANSISVHGFPNDATKNEALQLGLSQTVSSSRSKQRLDSYMGRVNYGFKEKYFLDLTARVDGSSKFGADHKYGVFPAISGAWRIIEESFLKNSRVFSDLKLRASYGITGNAGGISPYQSLATVAATGSNYDLDHQYAIGINPTGIANPDLRWEKSKQTDIGLDIGLFKQRVTIVADYYFKKTNDLLYVKTLPLSSGYSSMTGNFAALQNKGFEFAINADIARGELKWNASANISFNRNKVLDLDGETDEVFVTSYSVLKVGAPLGVFKTYVFDGINQTDEAILPGYDGRTGGYKVKDMNGDGIISSDDQVISGDPTPKFIYGFSNNLSFKNFDFSIFVSGTYGNKIYNASELSFEMPLGQRNMFAGVAKRWSPTNPSNDYVSGFQGGRLPITDHPVSNGSYLRAKNISLGYTFHSFKWASQLRIYLSANNLFTITGYDGYDPEVNSYAGSNTVLGVDNLVYPQARSFLAGIDITF